MSFTKSQLFKIPGISQLQYSDEAYFRAIFPKDSLHYSYSWLYVLRASHLAGGQLGYKYVAPDFVAIIGYRNGYAYVTPIVDMTKAIKTKQLCQELVDQTSCRVIIKKVPIEQHKSLNAREPAELEETSLFEDDANPETLLQLQRIFVSTDGEINSSAKRFVRKIRAFEERGKEVEVIENIASVPFAQLAHFLRMDKEKYENYIPLLKYLAEQPPEDYNYKYRTLVFLLDKKIRGIYIAEVLSLTELGFYCGVTSKDEPGLTEWMDAFFFRKMYLEGVKTVYLGGSEKHSIAHFVKKLLPYKPHYSVKAMFFEPSMPDTRVTVRLAQEKDIKGLADLYRRFYNEIDILSEHWTGESARKLMTHFYKRQPDLFYVAEKNNVIVGAAVAIVQPWWDGNHLLDGDVFIDSKYGKQDIESKLMRALLLRARESYDVVAWDSIIPTVEQHPLANYKRLGFADVPEWSSVSGDTHKMLELLEAG